jgi:hypothetical protein
MKKIVIATACSRLDNLENMHQSIQRSSLRFPNEFVWMIVLDRSLDITPEEVKNRYKFLDKAEIILSAGTKSIGGYVHKNVAVKTCRERYPDYWVHFLDDDTICHPDFFQLCEILDETKTFAVFHQSFDETFLRHIASYDDIRPGRIDMGQYVLNIKKLPDTFFFDENEYMSDGIEIGKLYDSVRRDDVQIVDAILSFFNYLNPPHWLPPKFPTNTPIPIGLFFE